MREDLLAQGYKPALSASYHQLRVIFINSGNDPALKEAELWFDEAMNQGKLGPGDRREFITYEGHRWNIRVDGHIVHEFVMNDEVHQSYTI